MKKIQADLKKIYSSSTALNRNRIHYFFLTMLVIFSGLMSRKFAPALPEFINLYLGDALWALMIFVMTGLLFSKVSIGKVGVIAIAFCCLIELSQLYHSPWIDSIRQTTIGGLVLGFGFLWSDILAYSLGVAFGIIMETVYYK